MVQRFSQGFYRLNSEFETRGLVEGKRRERRRRKGEMWMWSNEQFLTKRFELSVKILKKFVHIFPKDPNWKTGCGRMHLIKWFPLPWVVQLWPILSRRKAQGLLEPVTKSNIFAWEIEFGRTQTLSFKPGYSKVVCPPAESWSDDRWVHSVT